MAQDSEIHKVDENEHIDQPIGTTCNSKTYKKTTCKDIYVTISYKEDDPKKIDYIRINSSSKDNNCAVSFMEALSDTLTFAIRRIRNSSEAAAIVKNLRFHKCLNCPVNKDHTTSCADAIGQILEREFASNEISK
jgi:hypothetical protein